MTSGYVSTTGFSVREGRRILERTMRSLGYNQATAELGVWSAIWLEERFDWGILKLVSYLIDIKNVSFEELRPQADDEFGLRGVCPFMLAEKLISLSDIWVPKGGFACCAPANTALAMAPLADWASLRGKSVRLKHLDYQCLFSSKAVDLETDNSRMFGWIDVESKDWMQVELSEDPPVDTSHRKLTSIKLPTVRLRNNSILDLDYRLA